MKLISSGGALQDFRSYWDGPRLLRLVQDSGGAILVPWAVGVGKSAKIDEMIEAALESNRYDLVVALLPTRQVINERRWIQFPPPQIPIANLKPRPKGTCGTLNEDWRHYEGKNLGVLGRVNLCGSCRKRKGCFWPRQYGKSLRGISVVFATQTHLERDPQFPVQLKHWTGANNLLVLLDEVGFIMRSLRHKIELSELKCFVETLQLSKRGGNLHRDWRYQCELLLDVGTSDLRSLDWNLPPVFPDWALQIQREGWRRFGKNFNFLGYTLSQFQRSPLESRERDRQGTLHFAERPFCNFDVAIFSGTVDPEFAQFRLRTKLAEPFQNYCFRHPDTRWYNLSSRLGTRRYFAKNSPQILDLFAALTYSRIRAGRRVLLVAKKCFIQICSEGIRKRLKELGLNDIRILTSGWASDELNSKDTIPLINFGTIGTNRFEEFDCAYCLTGYYVNEGVVDQVLQDVCAADFQIPIRITTTGKPRRRKATVINPQHRIYDIQRLAQLALNQQELDTVLQAVGRVRPYTKPREIITFQCAEHPHIKYEKEFCSVGEAREFFGFKSRRVQRKTQLSGTVQNMKKAGRTQREVADEIGASLRTVKRHWNKQG